MNLRLRYQALMRRVAAPLSRVLVAVDPRHVYIGLAVALAAWTVATTLFDRQHRVKTSTYDWMLNHRFHVPAPDPDIVLLDIDERSLAAMAEEYGRWPWPRDVLATVLAGLEAEGAKAVVFDILFSDADKQNPVSERAFEEAIDRSRVAYFPVLRLDPANDAKSALRADSLKGLVVVNPSATNASADVDPAAVPRTLAVVLPYFDSAVRGGRLGTHNVDPDPDSIVRSYRVWEDVGGYRVLSLPARMAIDFGWPLPDLPSKKLQFNDRALAYRTLSFADVFGDFMRKARTRPVNEFRDKIVVIGATAPGLFDLKGTPISRTDPGMDILATAIDNVKHDRFFRELSVPVEIALALLLLVLMTWLCIRYSHEQLKLAFVIAPALLVGISYLSMNVSNTFVDLTAPASIAFLYFSLVKIYSAQIRKRCAGDTWFAPVLDPRTSYWLGCLAATLPPQDTVRGFETRYLNLLRIAAPNSRVTSGLGAQTGWLGAAFSGILVATWLERADDVPAIERARAEAARLFAGVQTLHEQPSPTQHCFLERTLEAEVESSTVGAKSKTEASAMSTTDSIAPQDSPVMRTVRALVSRTVLQVAEGSSQ